MSSLKPLKRYPTPLNLADYPDDFSPCHRRVLSARGIAAQQLAKPLSALIPVEQLTDAHRAAERIYHAITNAQQIVIVGDYDADGATAMAVMVSVLRHVGARYDVVVPNRVSMGYGLSDKAVQVAREKHVELLITVDNGISAVEAVSQLNASGVDVIITDHHLPAAHLPQAYAIVNPNRTDCDFPCKALAGVGVAFYVMLALRQVFRQHDDTRLETFSMGDLLPYVAIGTVADVVPLDYTNRILIEQGLKRIRAERCAMGISALIEVAKLSPSALTASHIGFQIAPRLNAAGRIADMRLGVDCLLATNARLAMDYALELNRLNHERRTIENEMRSQADNLLSRVPSKVSDNSLCLFDPDWNEGVIGILASRIKDQHDKTVFVFTRAEADMLKASGRAGTAVNLVEALHAFHHKHPNVLKNYGGHAKAAGLTLSLEQLPVFEAAIEAIISEQLAEKTIDDGIYTDGELLPYELNIANAEFLQCLEPWGCELPEPLFDNRFYVEQVREVGKNHAQLSLFDERSLSYFRGIAFDQFATCDKLAKTTCRVAYHLDINEWQGRRNLSLVVKQIAPE